MKREDRKRASEILKQSCLIAVPNGTSGDDWNKSIDMAIKLLEQEPCEDCVSRKAYIERYRKWAYSEYGRKIGNDALAIKVAMSLPPVTPQESKMGHWIYLKHNKARCSECDDVVLIAQTYGKANYFPNCGAKMESEG